MPVADEGASYPATGTTDAAPNTSLSTAAYFGSAGFFRSSSATFFAEVPFATLAGQGDETAASLILPLASLLFPLWKWQMPKVLIVD